MSRQPRPFTVGLIQMRCSTDPDDNLRAGVRRCCARPRIAAPRSPACPSCFAPSTSARPRTPRGSIWPSRFPARPPTALRPVAQRNAHGRRRLDLRAPRSRALPQHGRRHRRRRHAPRPLSQDAHSRRPALLREVLLHSRRPRVSGVRHRRSPGSGPSFAGTSGIPKPPG